MTQEQIQAYNILCARFMNMEDDAILLEMNRDRRSNKNYLHFHYDWEWIMRVVAKICNKGFRKYTINSEEGCKCVFTDMAILEQPHSFDGGNIVAHSGDVSSEKQAVVEAINKFLIWDNANNK